MKYFDIVIPVGPNDEHIVENQINYTKENIIGYRNIYLVSYNPNLVINNCITINENIFPFTKETISNIHGKNFNNGWYLQQLLKLYAGFIIPNILDRYLVIDADTFFLKKTYFIENNKCLYNYSTEHHKPYFEHMNKLNIGIKRAIINKSGICHHMMFEKKYLKEMFEYVEKVNNDLFYNVFLKNVTTVRHSGASEYEIYFNYMLIYHKNEIVLRKLKWKNSKKFCLNDKDCHYISCHWYMRK